MNKYFLSALKALIFSTLLFGSCENFAATIEVNDAGDSSPVDGCTLRQAILSANTNSVGSSGCAEGEVGEDTINFASSVMAIGEIKLNSALPQITEPLNIVNSGDRNIILNAQQNGRIFNIETTNVLFENLTLTGGSAADGAGVFSNRSNLYFNGCFITGNAATGSGGGINSQGRFSGEFVLNQTTVSGNTAEDGAGIYNVNTQLFVNNSTISNNTATDEGGGIWIGFGNMNITNSTIVANNAVDGGGVAFNSSGETLRFNNAILSGNSASSAGDEIIGLSERPIFAVATSIFGDSGKSSSEAFSNSTPPSSARATSDSAQPVAFDSLVEGLADNGGRGSTHNLVSDGPAVDAGDNTVCENAPINNIDQRGQTRPVGEICDLGAIEYIEPEEDNSFQIVVPLEDGGAIIFSL